MPSLPKPRLKSNMQSLLERGKAFLTPISSSQNLSAGGFTTVKADTALFPKPDPNVDGEDCLQDCSTCTVHYPNKFSIDEDDKLYGQVKGWDTHLVVGTGKTDWVRDVTDEKGSVMEAVGKYGQEYTKNGGGKAKLMLSASNMPTGGAHGDCDMEEGSDCYLLPSWEMVRAVQPDEVEGLMHEVVERSITNKTLLKDQKRPSTSDHKQHSHANGAHPAATHGAPTDTGTSTPNNTDTPPDLDALTLSPSNRQLPIPRFSSRTKPIPHSALILMCSHKTRDARCGQSAPLLRKEFERHLRPLGLYRDLHDERPGGVGIYFINHVGGHKYSANVMIYRRKGSLLPKPRTSADRRRVGLWGNVGETERVINREHEAEHDRREKAEELHDEAVQGIWLARVRPEDCENIVRYTVLQGKVVKPERQLRGGFDRERGLVSW